MTRAKYLFLTDSTAHHVIVTNSAQRPPTLAVINEVSAFSDDLGDGTRGRP